MEVKTYTSTVEVYTCCNKACGVKFGLDSEYGKRMREDHAWFHCPNGHLQHFTGESTEERLARELKDSRESNAFLYTRNEALHDKLMVEKNKVRAQKAAKTRIKNRIANGVCPCCNRSFKNVHSHFRSQHPLWLKEHPEIKALSVHKKINLKTKS